MRASPILPVVPHPASVVCTGETFHLRFGARLEIVAPELLPVARWLRAELRRLGGHEITVQMTSAATAATSARADLTLALGATDARLGEEGYRLEVRRTHVAIEAATVTGVFRGAHTLAQLFWSEPGVAPGVTIVDFPRFRWRGVLLDVSRHFFSIEFVKSLLDEMARRKLNVLHWHLTDDCGWRIEIKALPQLTAIGAWRVPRTGPWQTFNPPQPGEPVTMPPAQPGEAATYGGFYTQEEIREVVAYAAERHITIVPEIDVPGHSLALIAAMPQLSCTGERYAVNAGSYFRGIVDSSLCAGNEEVFQVLETVFREVTALFPGEFVHVGGDECDKAFWRTCPRCRARMDTEGLRDFEALQGYFIRRVAWMLARLGKRVIGWDEILEGGLAPDAAVMSWRGIAGARAASTQGHPVVMTPHRECYLDYCQGERALEPVGPPPNETEDRLLRLSQCYAFEPAAPGVDPQWILGAQACLWTEFIAHPRHAQYMMWPRALALAETFWSPPETRDWPGFVARMEQHLAQFDANRIKYARSVYVPTVELTGGGADERVVLRTEVPGLDIHYTFDGSEPDEFYPRYVEPLSWPAGATEIRAVAFRAGRAMSRPLSLSLAELRARAARGGARCRAS